MPEPKAKSGSELLLRSALARRDYWVNERRVAQQAGNTQQAEAAARFVAEYDALIAMTIDQTADPA